MIERLRELLEYRDGGLYWRQDRGSQKCKGQLAGTPNTEGYLKIRVRELGGAMGAHRIVFAMHHGYLPELVDHINGNKQDNRIENLREATRSHNGLNRGASSVSKSGCKNVYPYKDKWMVQMRVKQNMHYLGIFEDLEFADLVAHCAREKYHGKYANHSGAK